MIYRIPDDSEMGPARSAGAARHFHNVPGTKLVKRFIKQAVAEHTPYKDTLAKMSKFVDYR